MSDSRRLAVVVPCFNKVFYTQKTVESLLATTHSNMTLIIVDDGSTDNTADYCAEIAARMNKEETHFYCHKTAENIGVNAAWNTGLRIAMAAEFPYICIANNDLLFTDGWDIPLLNALDADYHLVSPFSTEQAIPADWPMGSTRHTNPASAAMAILGACFMFKRDLIQTIGYFPEEFKIYFGDNWIQDMTRVRNLKTGHIHESYIHHFFCQTTSGIDNNKHWPADGAAYNKYCEEFKLPGA